MQTNNDLQNKSGKMKPLQSTPIGAALFYIHPQNARARVKLEMRNCGIACGDDFYKKRDERFPARSAVDLLSQIGAALFYFSINMGEWSCEEQMNREK